MASTIDAAADVSAVIAAVTEYVKKSPEAMGTRRRHSVAPQLIPPAAGPDYERCSMYCPRGSFSRREHLINSPKNTRTLNAQ